MKWTEFVDRVNREIGGEDPEIDCITDIYPGRGIGCEKRQSVEEFEMKIHNGFHGLLIIGHLGDGPMDDIY